MAAHANYLGVWYTSGRYAQGLRRMLSFMWMGLQLFQRTVRNVYHNCIMLLWSAWTPSISTSFPVSPFPMRYISIWLSIYRPESISLFTCSNRKLRSEMLKFSKHRISYEIFLDCAFLFLLVRNRSSRKKIWQEMRVERKCFFSLLCRKIFP